mgnify:CR=1 FL=1
MRGVDVRKGGIGSGSSASKTLEVSDMKGKERFLVGAFDVNAGRMGSTLGVGVEGLGGERYEV